MPRTQARLATRANVFKALAHPSRLLIVEQLAQNERCVCELTEMIGADMSTVSKHLSVLKGAGIIQDDKRGLQVYYRLKMPVACCGSSTASAKSSKPMQRSSGIS